MPEQFYLDIKKELEAIQNNGAYRFLKPVENHTGKYIYYNNKKYLNLSSNDYLGLASDTALHREFYRDLNDGTITEKFGPGSASSRLLTGDHQLYAVLERAIDGLFAGTVAASAGIHSRVAKKSLVFNSGYHANTGILPAIAGKGDLVLSDSLNHASIIDGIRLSGADTAVYGHLDYNGLEQVLMEKRNRYRRAFIVTESVFSMDGDIADLNRLVEVKKKHDAVLYVDEAHAFGVFGGRGLGVSEEQGVIDDTDITIITFGKSLGSMGAAALTRPPVRDFLVNTARTLIYTTALPPVVAHWNAFAVNRLPDMGGRMRHLLGLCRKLRNGLEKQGLSVTGESQIVPVVIGGNEEAIRASERLMKAGYLLCPVRPPTVPAGSSRIRISLRSDIEWDDIEAVPEIIADTMNSILE